MYDSAKYLIHADIRASGVVERSDVVGAVFGQTEGLLGEGLDLRDLQESSKLGRIDVEVESERGSSFGEITIASGLDRVETAILAAALESIERVGPCRADIEVSEIEDVRTAKRRRIVERAKELIAEFDEAALNSEDLVEEVRRSVRVEDITEFHGLPAGPRVAESDAVVVVEGRADVQTLLRYGVKNAIAVEGTDVPDEVAELTNERTVTAFLDGDRGGDLILKELGQVGDVDYVALAPSGRSVEDLSRDEVMSALRDKVPFEAVSDAEDAEAAADLAATDGSTRPAPPEALDESGPETTADAESAVDGATVTDRSATDDGDAGGESEAAATTDETTGEDPVTDEPSEPETLAGHVAAVVGSETGLVRLLDRDQSVLAEGPAADAFDLVESAATVPAAVVLDGAASQRLLDVAAQRGVEQVVARSEGEYVKQPTDVRVRLASEIG